MPITLPKSLPAFSVLRDEGVMVMDKRAAKRQDIRPLQIALLNLMPKKIQTEIQFARLIGATPLQIELTLIRMSAHQTRNTPNAHMDNFYQPFSAVRDKKFDGFIITGAPIETLPYTKVSYWDELVSIFDWTQSHTHAVLGVCWAGMAMLKHFYGIKKEIYSQKLFGCYRQENLAKCSPYLRGFSDDCIVPVSRWANVCHSDLEAHKDLKILMGSAQTGACLIDDPRHRTLHIFNHFEYDDITLSEEYERDIAAGESINIPQNYYLDDDPSKAPVNRWRSHAHLLFCNWINQIYQTTPYNIDEIAAS